MMINLYGTTGAIIFFIILIFLQLFFGMVGGLLSNFIGLSGMNYWIMTLGVVLIADLIFVNIE